MHSHDTGRYIQPYGHAVRTPNLQALAEQGVLFRENHCACPTCSPSRSALLTGIYPHENGMLGLAHRGWSLRDPREHLAHQLSDAGYLTALSGVQHVAQPSEIDGEPFWHRLGYHQYLGNPERAEAQAADFLESKPAEPFFLSCGFMETHREFPALEPGDPEKPMFTAVPSPLPDTPENRRDMAEYNKCARILDEKMGRVLLSLEQSGLSENTLVICTTDHGIAFPRMKCNLEDSGTGTMLIMRGPGGFTGGKVVDAMTSHLDLYPTICELSGISPPERLRGSSLLPLVREETKSVHEELYSEVTYHAGYEPMRAVRTDRYKYIRRFGDRRRPLLPNCDNGRSKNTWLEAGWRDTEAPAEALFDLILDPNEMNSLATDASYLETLLSLSEKLDAWMEETADPLVDGPVIPPPGAEVTWPDANGPRDTVMRVLSPEG
jgi:arylsulfatase A-like enzyme